MVISSDKLAGIIAEGMAEKKAHDITILDLRKVTHSVTDFFVIAHGNSTSQVSAIADSIETEVKKITGEYVWKKEGQANAEWILLDYFNVVAHVFNKNSREYYNLESIWGDAKVTKIES